MKSSSKIFLLTVFMFIVGSFLFSQPMKAPTELSVRYEELTAPEFVSAVALSESVCIIPVGILEKHGPHLPLGTDLLTSREISLMAAKKEYCVVFPEFYAGQIYEAKHQAGTIAYSPELVWNLFQQTCNELARNGFKKIILVNGHGGNNSLLSYFCQSQLSSPRDYAVVLFMPATDSVTDVKIKKLRKTTTGGHADEVETSMMLAFRPDLVHVERAGDQSGADQQRLKHLPFANTGIWWYARYPNHYAGNGSDAKKEIGELMLNSRVEQLVTLIREFKKDTTVRALQNEFFNKTGR
jgi:creatinine amidohydrolase